jgi:glycosyltransferase involved in cell wall biosynthesis
VIGSYSDVELASADYNPSRTVSSLTGPLKIVTVGSLAQRYKGVDVLLRAVAALRDKGTQARVTVVGDGKYRTELEKLADLLSVEACFRGAVPRAQVLEILDASDLFVLASKTEGLPRALIEAMARSLPCIATRVGGNPELLCDDDLVESDRVDELTSMIAGFATDTERMQTAGRRNFEVAQRYREDVLTKKRREFYLQLRLLTEEWRRSAVGTVQDTHESPPPAEN